MAAPGRKRSRRVGAIKKRRPQRQSSPPVKVSAPVVPHAYRRLRLFRLLDKARRESNVTWIAAPGGAGKTTLVVSYLEVRKLVHLWYQIDAGDRDLANFFHYLGLTVAQAAPRFRKPLPKLTPEYLGGVNIFARNFFRELAQRVSMPFMLVFDNVQDLGADDRFYEILSEALGELPRGVHVMLLSRAQPPPSFARLHANREMVELGWSEIRLMESELRPLLRVLGSDMRRVATAEIENLYLRCDGWIAGLILQLGAPEQRLTAPATPDTEQKLFDYFAAEVFARRPAIEQQFLMLTALFPDFTVDMAARLTGNAHARTLLNDLVRSHQFTERRRESSNRFQYHPLFREFLLEQVRDVLGAGELSRCCRRAGMVLEEAGDLEAASRLFDDAGDYESGARLIRAQASDLAATGRFATLSGLIGRLPAPMVKEDPWLLYWRGVSRVAFEPVAAREDFEYALEELDRRGEVDGVYRSWAAIIESLHVEWLDFRPVDKWIDVFSQLRPRYPEFPSPAVETSVVGAVVTALTNRDLGHPLLPEWLSHAETLLQASGDTRHSVWWAAQMFIYYVWIGRREKAEGLANLLESMADDPDTSVSVRLMCFASLACYQWWFGRPNFSIQLVDKGADVAQQYGLPFWLIQLLGQGVYASLALSKVGDAASYLERMRPLVLGRGQLYESFFFHLSSMIAAHKGDWAVARQHAGQALQSVGTTGFQFGLASCLFMQAIVAALDGHYAEAEEAIVAVRRIAHQSRSALITIWCRSVDALLAIRRDSEELLLPKLAAFLNLSCETQGPALPWFPQAMLGKLYSLALRHDIETEHVRSLIRRFNIKPPEQLGDISAWPYPVKVRAFGTFQVFCDDRLLTFRTKAQKKPLQLLKVLIALGGHQVREEKVMDFLWPEAESAERALKSAVHRLRKLIGEQSLERQEGRITLNRHACWVDAWSAEQLLVLLDQSRQHGEPQKVVSLVEQILALYSGPFLASEFDSSWALSARERLREKLLRNLENTVRYLQRANEHEQALACSDRALEIDPLAEPFYRALIQSYLATDRPSQALAAYERCRRVLQRELRVAPASATSALVQPLMQARG